VDGWINAGNLRLAQSDLDEIAGAIERTSAGTGPPKAATRKETAKA
jgi:hypothetical protein